MAKSPKSSKTPKSAKSTKSPRKPKARENSEQQAAAADPAPGIAKPPPAAAAAAAASLSQQGRIAPTGDQPIELTAEIYADFIATRAAEIADRRISRRESLWRGLTAAVLAVLGILGYTSITSQIDERLSGLDERIRERVEQTVPGVVDLEFNKSEGDMVRRVQIATRDDITRSINERTADLRANIEVNSDLAALLAVANRIGLRERLKSEDIDLAEKILRRTSKADRVINREEYLPAVEEMVDAVQAIDVENGAGFMDRLLPHIIHTIETDEGIWHTLIRHYGMRYSALPNPSALTEKTFRDLSGHARRYKQPYVVKFFELVRDYRDNGGVTPKGEMLAASLLKDDTDRLGGLLRIFANIHEAEDQPGLDDDVGRETLPVIIDYKLDHLM